MPLPQNRPVAKSTEATKIFTRSMMTKNRQLLASAKEKSKAAYQENGNLSLHFIIVNTVLFLEKFKYSAFIPHHFEVFYRA